MRKTDARFAAYSSLLRCESDRKYSNLEVDSAIGKYKLEGAEKGLYTTLVYGVLERLLTLDYIIAKLSSRPVSELDAEVRILLRLGLYQLIWLDRIPERAAVSESVELAKAVAPRAAAFVNALLRSFLRTIGRDKLPYPDRSDRIKYLSVRYSCSEDVIRTLEACAGDAEPLLAAFEVNPTPTLRVNTLKISRDALLSQLSDEGVGAQATKYSPFGIKLEKNSIPAKITELISAGYVYIQDEASQLALCAAEPKPGMIVIDACACPGGKSFSAAMLMENQGRVMSFDLHKNKLSLIGRGAERLGISIITTAEKNGAEYDANLCESADLVLCDAPCSGLGVIAKKPELRYKRREEIERLPEIQYAILSNCARYVKPGGRLYYTTCTLNRAENQAVAERFLSESAAFEPIRFDAGGIRGEDGLLTLMPQLHGTDGFFISGFKKKYE